MAKRTGNKLDQRSGLLECVGGETTRTLSEIIGSYDATKGLAGALTIPSAWYTDPRVHALERTTIFSKTWQMVARVDQLHDPGRYVTADLAGEPLVIVRGRDSTLRAFFNVCRHHAAAVMTEPAGRATVMRCPYHGWTYALDGSLKGTPEFDGVCDFDKSKNGLIAVRVDVWEKFVFVCLSPEGPNLHEWLGDLIPQVASLNLGTLRFIERRTYELACNWKVFVDNYLDGGYHVPHIHKGLSSVLEYSKYTIENHPRFCVQTSPLSSGGGDTPTAAVRRGNQASYIWLFPNFMLNWYQGYMDTNLVLPRGVDRCLVVFDFFMDAKCAQAGETGDSIAVADRVQQEDVDVCESVQIGLQSQAYDTGRLSVRREAGEHLFHRLMYEQLQNGVTVLNG